LNKIRIGWVVLALILLFTISCSSPTLAEQISAKNINKLALTQIIIGHTMGINPIAFSPDGQLMASGSYDKTIKLWRVKDAALINTLDGHTNTVYGVAFSPDGSLLASASADKTVRIWRVSDGTLLKTLNSHTDCVRDVAFSPNGKLLASASLDKTIKIWSIPDGTLMRTLNGHQKGVYNVAFNPQGSLLASASEDTRIAIWRVSDGKLLNTINAHADLARVVAFSPDGQILASGSYDKSIKLWRVDSGKLIRSLNGHGDAVYDLVFSPNGQLLSSASKDMSVKIWNLADGSLLTSLSGYDCNVYSVAFSPDAQILASGSDDGQIRMRTISDKAAAAKIIDAVNQSANVKSAQSTGTPQGKADYAISNSDAGYAYFYLNGIPVAKVARGSNGVLGNTYYGNGWSVTVDAVARSSYWLSVGGKNYDPSKDQSWRQDPAVIKRQLAGAIQVVLDEVARNAYSERINQIQNDINKKYIQQPIIQGYPIPNSIYQQNNIPNYNNSSIYTLPKVNTGLPGGIPKLP